MAPARLRAPRAAAAPVRRAAGTGAVQQAPGRLGRGAGGWIRLRTPRRGLSPQHLKRQLFFFFPSLIFFFSFSLLLLPPSPPFLLPAPFPLSYVPGALLPAEAELQAEVGLRGSRPRERAGNALTRGPFKGAEPHGSPTRQFGQRGATGSRSLPGTAPRAAQPRCGAALHPAGAEERAAPAGKAPAAQLLRAGAPGGASSGPQTISGKL